MIGCKKQALAARVHFLHMLCINPKYLLALSFVIFARSGKQNGSSKKLNEIPCMGPD